MNNPKILALLTIVLWSFGMYIGRLIAIKSQFLLISLSLLFSFITILVYTALVLKDFSFLRLKAYHWLYFLTGPLGYFVYSVGQNQSSRQFNGMSETTILNYTWPIFTIIFTQMLAGNNNNRFWVRVVEALGVLVGFGAVVNLATHGNFSSFNLNVPGILWGLLSGAAYGLYSAYSGGLKAEEQSVFLVVSTGFSLLLAGLLSFSELGIISTLTWTDLGVTFISGCLLSGVGYITWTRANRLAREQSINISSIASIMFVLPVISLVIVSLLLGETLLLQPYFLGSLGLIVISSILCQRVEPIASKVEGMLQA
jgi:drug/metabolite transporter (DMT)-like permease